MAQNGGYTVGNLDVTIRGISSGAINSIDKVINRLTKLQGCLKGLDLTKITGLSNNSFNFGTPFGGINVAKEQAKKLKSQNRFFAFSHLFIAYRMARRLGSALGNIVQSGTDYTETLNLWSVAMRKNIDLADQFVNKMNKAYGISEKTLMNAQAIFKNMIGSLGQISDDTAYQLSEAITQMAVDYSSLYNVQLKSAFSKFQAMLAGQVRPIRSVSGYDITETTLFQLYQSIGGTKTMRQLTRTEKQLLSIYAVFKQMSASGALGDMTKTLDQFANQSRMMAENFQRTGMWAGVILKHLLQESGIMVHINAMLIYFSEILKAIALRIGATGDEDFFEPLYQGAENATTAIETLKGTLLDFDEFRALDSAGGDSLINIDEKLLNAIKGYSGLIDQTKNSAHDLAMEWLSALGFTQNANGELTVADSKIDGIIDKVKSFVNFLKATLITFIGYKIANSITSVISAIGTASGAINPLIISVGMLVYGILQFKNAWADMSTWDRIINVISAITAGILGLVVATKALGLGLAPAIGIGMALAGTVMALQTQITPKKYANGGMPQAGTLFVAGEAGAEVVYNNANGQSGVANIAQLKSAFYQALVEYGTSYSNDDNIVVQIDGEEVFNVTRARAKSQGLDFAKVGGR